MSRTTYFARWTVERTLRSISRSSFARSLSANAPPAPMPAFSAATASRRPVAVTRRHSSSTPSAPAPATPRPVRRTPPPQLLDTVSAGQVDLNGLDDRAAELTSRAGELLV